MQMLPTLEETWTAIEALPDWQGFLLVVGASLVFAVVLHVGGDRVIPRVTRTIPGEVDDVVLRTIHPPLYLTVAIAGSAIGITLFDLGTETVETIRLSMLSLVTVIWALTLLRVGRKVSAEVRDNRYIDKQIVPIFQNVWSAVVVIVSLLLLLTYWNIDVTPILASAGIIGIVVGLAARDTLANFFGSISLYADGTYRVGDYVVLESGERGRVEDISVRSTVIRTRDDILVTVPNSVLSNGSIINESAPRRKRRIKIPVGVAYGSDVDEVEEILLAAATDHSKVVDRPEPRARFRSFGDSALQFELLCWVPHPELRGRVSHDLNKAVYEGFIDAGVEIPFPQRDVQVSFADGNGHEAFEEMAVREDGS